MVLRIHYRRIGSDRRSLRWLEYVLALTGLLALGYCAFAYLEARLYQMSELDHFEEMRVDASVPAPRLEFPSIVPQAGTLFSRIDVPHVGISAMVVEGITARDLRIAVGHIPGTALPGERGNVGLAGHRDTFFRNLRKIKRGDSIRLTTLNGSYGYTVESMRVVDPGSIEVLQPSSRPVLTLVTCYPFYYIGAAPKRFIVQAVQSSIR